MAMANMFQYFSLLRILCLILFFTFNNISNSISSNISTKCFRRTYYAVQGTRTPKCNAQSSDIGEVSATMEYSLNKLEQYKRLPRIDPVKVGYTRQVQHDGKTYTLKTLSVRPPIFEIQNFLSGDECDYIVQMAMLTGMATSATIWSEYDEVLADGNLRAVFERLDVNNDNSLDYFELGDGIRGIKDIQVEREDLKQMFQNFDFDFLEDDKITFNEFKVLTSPEVLEQIKTYLGKLEEKKSSAKMRQSFSAFLDPYSGDDSLKEFFKKLHRRISKVTQLPIEMIRSSEELQIIKYEVGGHYHAHHDSESSEYAPCCHLIQSTEDLCRPCRYATMFYYLNEPLKGGGTAFPFADNVTYDDEKLIRDEKHRLNLSSHCDKANLVYLPKKGAALFWYNHVTDGDTGWMGKLDEMSIHGGCDVIQGEKWGANNWLNADIDREADLEIWEKFRDPS